ncbi:MAG TPA: hypothetical protein DIV86_04845 [Alphaproteobacteria bacterium]|nr:hypothetical protein [Alphaproteobacteria bacterium]
MVLNKDDKDFIEAVRGLSVATVQADIAAPILNTSIGKEELAQKNTVLGGPKGLYWGGPEEFIKNYPEFFCAPVYIEFGDDGKGKQVEIPNDKTKTFYAIYDKEYNNKKGRYIGIVVPSEADPKIAVDVLRMQDDTKGEGINILAAILRQSDLYNTLSKTDPEFASFLNDSYKEEDGKQLTIDKKIELLYLRPNAQFVDKAFSKGNNNVLHVTDMHGNMASYYAQGFNVTYARQKHGVDNTCTENYMDCQLKDKSVVFDYKGVAYGKDIFSRGNKEMLDEFEKYIVQNPVYGNNETERAIEGFAVKYFAGKNLHLMDVALPEGHKYGDQYTQQDENARNNNFVKTVTAQRKNTIVIVGAAHSEGADKYPYYKGMIYDNRLSGKNQFVVNGHDIRLMKANVDPEMADRIFTLGQNSDDPDVMKKFNLVSLEPRLKELGSVALTKEELESRIVFDYKNRFPAAYKMGEEAAIEYMRADDKFKEYKKEKDGQEPTPQKKDSRNR